MHQPDGCLGGLSSDEYTAADFVYCRRLYLYGGDFPFPWIFQYNPYTELAIDFYHSSDDTYRIFDAMADKGGKNFDKTAVMTRC